MLDENEKPVKLDPKQTKRMRKGVRRAVDNAIRLSGCEPTPFGDELAYEFEMAAKDEFVCQTVWNVVKIHGGYEDALAILERVTKNLREGHKAFCRDPETGQTSRKEALRVLRHGGRGLGAASARKL